MNKKLIKTITSLTLGLGTIAPISAIVSSCSGDKDKETLNLFMEDGGSDPDDTRTPSSIFFEHQDNKFNASAFINYETRNSYYTFKTYILLSFKYIDPVTKNITYLPKENINFKYIYTFKTQWINVNNKDLFKIYKDDRIDPWIETNNYFFNIHFNDEYEYRYTLTVKFKKI